MGINIKILVTILIVIFVILFLIGAFFCWMLVAGADRRRREEDLQNKNVKEQNNPEFDNTKT